MAIAKEYDFRTLFSQTGYCVWAEQKSIINKCGFVLVCVWAYND